MIAIEHVFLGRNELDAIEYIEDFYQHSPNFTGYVMSIKQDSKCQDQDKCTCWFSYKTSRQLRVISPEDLDDFKTTRELSFPVYQWQGASSAREERQHRKIYLRKKFARQTDTYAQGSRQFIREESLWCGYESVESSVFQGTDRDTFLYSMQEDSAINFMDEQYGLS